MVTVVTTIEAHHDDRIAVNTAAESDASQSEPENFWQKLDTRNRISLVLNGISVVVALGMIIMLLLITQSVRDLMTIESKLSGLSQFETRLSSRVETGDTALQGRLNDLDTQMSNISTQANELQMRLEILAGENSKLAEKIDRLEQASQTAGISPQSEDYPDENRVIRYAPKSATADSGAKNAAPKLDTSRFQRSVTSDGKVIYRRIN